MSSTQDVLSVLTICSMISLLAMPKYMVKTAKYAFCKYSEKYRIMTYGDAIMKLKKMSMVRENLAYFKQIGLEFFF